MSERSGRRPEAWSSSLAATPHSDHTCDLPERLVNHYREMLRAYVVMGVGNLADEMTALASLLAEAGISAQRTMQLHVHVLEELIGSLGNRSARHVMNRADLLVLEVMAHLADGYRRRYHERQSSARSSLQLPGFDAMPSDDPLRSSRLMSPPARSRSFRSNDATTTVAELRKLVADFVAERDWSQFHSPKNVSMALAIEAAELMEHFQWLTTEASRQLADDPEKLAEASARSWPTWSATRSRWPTSWASIVSSAIRAKMVKNAQKYPADEYRGRYGPEDDR